MVKGKLKLEEHRPLKPFGFFTLLRFSRCPDDRMPIRCCCSGGTICTGRWVSAASRPAAGRSPEPW